MKKLSLDISTLINEIDGDISLVKKAYRAAQVRQMWSCCVDEQILSHTNSVYIITDDDSKTLIVYVDDSIYAAELNARRELIKLKLLQDFQEDIQDFKILISRGSYKNNYPFKKEESINDYRRIKSKPLSEGEKKKVRDITSRVDDIQLRDKLERAIVLDWEWKKGLSETSDD